MKKVILFFSLIMLSASDIICQDIFITKNNDGIYKLLSNGNLEFIVDVEVQLKDIAISPSNKLYGMTCADGIVEINWQTGDYEIISTDLCLNSNSLVCANDNELFYMSNSSLFKYDIQLDTSILVSELGHETPGDVCIIRRNIIFPTHYDIKSYNIDTESLSTIYCFSEPQLNWGISAMYSECDSSTIVLSNTSTALNPDFLKINLESGATIPIEGDHTSYNGIWGMASGEEFAGMECESFEFTDIDCGEVVSNLNNTEESNQIHAFPNPVSQTLYLSECDELYNVTIYNNKGILLTKNLKVRNEIDMDRFVDGVYFLIVECGDIKDLHKIIKY